MVVSWKDFALRNGPLLSIHRRKMGRRNSSSLFKTEQGSKGRLYVAVRGLRVIFRFAKQVRAYSSTFLRLFDNFWF